MGHSLSRIAEELVRAGNGDSIRWQGLTLRSPLQPIYSVRQVGCIVHGPSSIRRGREVVRVGAAQSLLPLPWLCRYRAAL